MAYWLVNVKVETEEGKSIGEQYLVDAMSATECEAKVNELFGGSSLGFEVKGAKETKIKEVI